MAVPFPAEYLDVRLENLGYLKVFQGQYRDYLTGETTTETTGFQKTRGHKTNIHSVIMVTPRNQAELGFFSNEIVSLSAEEPARPITESLTGAVQAPGWPRAECRPITAKHAKHRGCSSGEGTKGNKAAKGGRQGPKGTPERERAEKKRGKENEAR